MAVLAYLLPCLSLQAYGVYLVEIWKHLISSITIWMRGFYLGIFKTSMPSPYYLFTVPSRRSVGIELHSLELENLSQPLYERSDLL